MASWTGQCFSFFLLLIVPLIIFQQLDAAHTSSPEESGIGKSGADQKEFPPLDERLWNFTSPDETLTDVASGGDATSRLVAPPPDRSLNVADKPPDGVSKSSDRNFSTVMSAPELSSRSKIPHNTGGHGNKSGIKEHSKLVNSNPSKMSRRKKLTTSSPNNTSTLSPTTESSAHQVITTSFLTSTTEQKSNTPHPDLESFDNNYTQVNTEPPVIGMKNVRSDFFVQSQAWWVEAKSEWGVAWHIHVFTVGPLFLLLAVYSLASLMRLRSSKYLLGRCYFLSLNSLLFLLGGIRSTYLLFCGYNSQGLLPPAVHYFLMDIGQPCLTSVFAILFLALLKINQVQLLQSRFQRPWVLVAVIFLHFSFSLASELMAGLVRNAARTLLLSQIIFTFMCLVLASTFCYIFGRLHAVAVRKQAEMIRLTFTKIHIDGITMNRKIPRPTLTMSVRVTLVTSFFLIILAVVHVYRMFFVHGAIVRHTPKPWPWLYFQFCSMFVELVYCLCITVGSGQALRQYEGQSRTYCSRFFACRCADSDCCCAQDPDSYDAYVQTHSNGVKNSFTGSSLSKKFSGKGNSLPAFKSVPCADPDITANGLIKFHQAPFSYTNSAPYPFTSSANKARLPHHFRALSDGMAIPVKTSTERRPTSLIYTEKGLIRFKPADDPEPSLEPGNENTEDEGRGSPSNWGSLLAEAGSSDRESLCDDDVVQSSLSPFFKMGYRNEQQLPRYRRSSRGSSDTLDNTSGGEMTSDHGNTMSWMCSFQGSPDYPNNAVDTQVMQRKCGSTCSSESAANSFDITFYLHRNGYEGVQAGGQELSKSGNVRSVSPLTLSTEAAPKRINGVPLTLNLSKKQHLSTTTDDIEDITPDSAVYLDLHLSRECQTECPTEVNTSPNEQNCSALSHSLGDLSLWKVNNIRSKRALPFVNKIKGSSFSLNTNLRGYEPLRKKLTAEEPFSVTFTGRRRNLWVKRHKTFISLSDVRIEDNSSDPSPQQDMALLGNCLEQEAS